MEVTYFMFRYVVYEDYVQHYEFPDEMSRNLSVATGLIVPVKELETY